MAREPYVALFKTASGSLACRQILADFIQSIAKQRIPPERLSRITTGTIGQVSVELEDFLTRCYTKARFNGPHGNKFLDE